MRFGRHITQSVMFTAVAGGASVAGACSTSDDATASIVSPEQHEDNEVATAEQAEAPTAAAEEDSSSLVNDAASPQDDSGPTGNMSDAPASPLATTTTMQSGDVAANVGAGGQMTEPEQDAQQPDASGAGGAVGADDPQDEGAGGTAAIASDDPPSMGGAGLDTNEPSCPESWGVAFGYGQPECAEQGLTCGYELSCSSGPVVLSVSCEDEQFVGAQECDAPYGFCPGTGPSGPSVLCEEGQWSIETWLRNVADGPRSCPEEPPEDKSPCIQGGTGGVDRDHCGYPCAGEGDGWTVISCVPAGEEGRFEWLSDGACE